MAEESRQVKDYSILRLIIEYVENLLLHVAEKLTCTDKHPPFLSLTLLSNHTPGRVEYLARTSTLCPVEEGLTSSSWYSIVKTESAV